MRPPDGGANDHFSQQSSRLDVTRRVYWLLRKRSAAGRNQLLRPMR
jgi:hypothetical protein